MLGKYNLKKAKYFLLLLLPILFAACSNDDEDVTALQPTEMEVTVFDDNGRTVANAEVRLYRSQRDFELLTREVVRGRTNAQGKVLFSDLQPVNYYFYAFYKNQSDGFIHSNYGNWDNDLFDRFSNISIYDFLTENGLTKVSVSTLFKKPINPTLVSFDEIIIIYKGEEQDFPFPAPDSLNIIFGLYEGFNPFQPAMNQDEILISLTNPTYTFFQESSSNILGELYFYSFDNQVIFDFNELVPQSFGGFTKALDLVPLISDDFTGDYDFSSDLYGLYPFLGINLYEALYQARESGDYPNRMIIESDAYLGKSNYAIDLILSWD